MRALRNALARLASPLSGAGCDLDGRPADVHLSAGSGPWTPEENLVATSVQVRQQLKARMEARQQMEETTRAACLAVFLNSATVEQVMAHYRSQIRMRRFFAKYCPKHPRHSGIYRWRGWTGCYHEVLWSGRLDRHYLVATQPELLYRKLLRFMLRRDGISTEALSKLEIRLDDWADKEGTPAQREAARVHRYQIARQRQDELQDRNADFYGETVAATAAAYVVDQAMVDEYKAQLAETARQLADREFQDDLDARLDQHRQRLMDSQYRSRASGLGSGTM